MKNLILIAPPGAGKGTLSKDLLSKYPYVHISTGDLLREQVAKGDELGMEIKKVQESGGLVSNEIVYKALENKLNDPKCDNGYILDGFPRNLEQAREYDEILKRSNRDLGIVILLDIPKEELAAAMKQILKLQGKISLNDLFKATLEVFNMDLKLNQKVKSKLNQAYKFGFEKGFLEALDND